MSDPLGANPYTGLPARPRRHQPPAASTPATLPCGHPVACLSEVAPDFAGDTEHPPREGTVYCRWCADVAKLAEAQQAFEELSKKQVEVNTWGLQIVDVLGQALAKIIDDGQPLTSRIEIKAPDGSRFPVVWLWVSVDPAGPVERVSILAGHKANAIAAAHRWKAAAKQAQSERDEARLAVGVMFAFIACTDPDPEMRAVSLHVDVTKECRELGRRYVARMDQVAELEAERNRLRGLAQSLDCQRVSAMAQLAATVSERDNMTQQTFDLTSRLSASHGQLTACREALRQIDESPDIFIADAKQMSRAALAATKPGTTRTAREVVGDLNTVGPLPRDPFDATEVKP